MESCITGRRKPTAGDGKVVSNGIHELIIKKILNFLILIVLMITIIMIMGPAAKTKRYKLNNSISAAV